MTGEFYSLLLDAAPDRSVHGDRLGGQVIRAFQQTWMIVPAAALALSVSASASAQAHTGTVAGTVLGASLDSSARHTRLGQVTIGVPDSGGRLRAPIAVTDGSGAFRLEGLREGSTKLVARRIGYGAETLTVVVSSGLVHVDFVLHPLVVQLEAAVAEADPTRGKMGPFNKRKARGVGAFLTRAEIDQRQPQTMSELLRYVPGVGVTQKMAGVPQPVHMQRSASTTISGACIVQLYVDGHPYPNGSVDDFRPSAIEGVEIYRSASEVPADFRSRDATCGLIALWTRDPDATSRRSP